MIAMRGGVILNIASTHAFAHHNPATFPIRWPSTQLPGMTWRQPASSKYAAHNVRVNAPGTGLRGDAEGHRLLG